MMGINRFRSITVTVLVCSLGCNLVESNTGGINVVPASDPNDVTKASIDVYKDLLSTLLTDYDTKVRPRLNQSGAVEVNTTFTLQSIVNFDTTGQRIDVMGFFIVTWYDEVLTWEPAHYEDTKYVKLPLNSIWYPKLVISKTYNLNTIIGNTETDAVEISYNGLVKWIPDGIYNSVCKVSVKYYPFDDQTCELIYYVSDETFSAVLLNGPSTIQLNDYMDNSEWHLLDVSVSVQERYTTNFVYLVCKVQRRADFTVYTMIVPLATLAVINVFTFLVPVESGEKGSLSITLFLACGFFVTITRDALPHNSVQVSYYIMYITVLLALSVFTVIYVIVEAKIYFSLGTSQFPISGFKSNKVRSTKLQVDTDTKALPEQELPDEDTFTWADMLNKLDMISFCTSSVLVVIFSTVLWAMVTNGN